MQCRYCFGTDDPDTLVAPCQCRGTSHYTHIACLQRYFTYYPDHMCRVCNGRMEYESTFDRVLPCLFVPVLAGILMMSSASDVSKIVLMTGLLGLSYVFATHALFTQGVAITSLLLGSLVLWIHQDPHLAAWIVGMFGLISLVQTLLQYVEPALLLFIVVIIFTMAYGTFFLLLMITYLDSVALAVLVIEAFLAWHVVLRLRPGPIWNRVYTE